ncbi:hypothetical protein SK128_018851, partial [Halocaridina rubra]
MKRKGQVPLRRQLYVVKLAELVRPWAEEKMYFQGMRLSIKMTIRTVLGIHLAQRQATQLATDSCGVGLLQTIANHSGRRCSLAWQTP